MRLTLSLFLAAGMPAHAAVRGAAVVAPALFGVANPVSVSSLSTFLRDGLPAAAPRLDPEAARVLLELRTAVLASPEASEPVLALLSQALAARDLRPESLAAAVSDAAVARALSAATLDAQRHAEDYAATFAAASTRDGVSSPRLSKAMMRLEQLRAHFGAYLSVPAGRSLNATMSAGQRRLGDALARRTTAAAKSAGVSLDDRAVSDTALAAAAPSDVLPARRASAARAAPASAARRTRVETPLSLLKAVSRIPTALITSLSAAIAPDESPAARSAPAPASSLWAPELLAAPLANDPMGVTIHRLSNGMTVYLSPNKQQPRVTAYTAVRAGSRQDPLDSTGMAHYLEHMLFKGTERLGTLDYEKEKPHLDRISALYEQLFTETAPERRQQLYAEIDAENQLAAAFAVPNEFDRLYKGLGFQGINAHTNTDETVYKADFPADRAETWARTETERFARPVFRLFQSELEAVYEENNMAQDNPDRAHGHALQGATFKGHPYGRPIIGIPDHLKNPSLAKMRAFYDAWYRPENMAVILSGDFDRAEMLTLLERNLGTLRPRTAQTPAQPAAQLAPLKGVERSEIFFDNEEALYVSWRTPEQEHADVDVLLVLGRLLGDPKWGLLNRNLAQPQLIKSLGGGQWQLKEMGAFWLQGVPKTGQTLEQAEALLIAEIEKVKAGEFADEDLRAAITNLEIGQKENRESDEKRVDSMLRSYVAGEEWRRSAQDVERLRRVTRDDVIRVARAYLGGDRAVVYRRKGVTTRPEIAKPDFTPIVIDPNRESPLGAELAAIPAAEPRPRWLKKGEDYAISSHSWGKLYWAKNTLNDLFSLKLVIPGGYRGDARASVATKLLAASGAGDMSPAEF
ncbi:MAG: insulinase family protein, partial [Elusimicrobia bacterium]|nr:insulinase family protein [Elusimicrobiota bacterium]